MRFDGIFRDREKEYTEDSIKSGKPDIKNMKITAKNHRAGDSAYKAGRIIVFRL